MTPFRKRLSRGWKYIVKGTPPPQPRQSVDLFTLMNLTLAAQALFTATQLGVADHLAAGPKSIQELARLTGAGETHLQQILLALAAMDVFGRDESGRFHHTPLSEQLISGRLPWIRNYILMWGHQYYAAAGQMLGMARKGVTAFELAYGLPAWEYIEPETGKLFVDYMSSVTDAQNDEIVKSFDFTPYKSVVDVGGGRASLMCKILKSNPQMKGTVLDQSEVEGAAMDRITKEGLTGRCTFSGGSFLASVPAGSDVYTIKHVLHDWADSEVPKILANIAAAMSEQSVLVIVEGLVNEANGADQVLKLQSLERMVLTGGKGRSERDFRDLLRGAGLRLEEIRHTSVFDCSLLIAKKG